MELWLLGAGALVLVGITLWIVWPARGADPVGTSLGSKEVVEKPMTETVTSGLAPQGDRFEDQYTSATADLSAGGVAAAVQGLQETPTTPPPFPAGTYGAAPFNPTATAAPYPQPETSSSLIPRRSVGLGAGAVLALGGGVGGAWLYARWQRERNKPINRIRRQAKQAAGEIRDRVPSSPEEAVKPAAGLTTALLSILIILWQQAQTRSRQADKVVSRQTRKAGKRATEAVSDVDWQKRLTTLKKRWDPSRLELEKISISRH